MQYKQYHNQSTLNPDWSDDYPTNTHTHSEYSHCGDGTNSAAVGHG